MILESKSAARRAWNTVPMVFQKIPALSDPAGNA